MARLFFAVQTPDVIREALRRAQGELLKLFDTDSSRLEHLENSHVTLAFLGEVEERLKHRLMEAAALEFSRSNVHAFELSLGAIEVNDKRHAKVIWASVLPEEPLERLHRSASDAAKGVNIPIEDRRFSPHLTLARFRKPSRVRDFRAPELPSISATVLEAVLIESVLGQGPPKHTILARYPLEGAC